MPELRQVRTLRLRAARREQVARTAITLEDALRTASLPQLPRGAILLVRRLDLGRLPADASPQWLSRHIATRLQALRLTPVRPDDDAPAAAPAVWFADRSEALAALLSASLQDAPRAWYWAGVLPGWRPGIDMRELLARVLRQAAAESQAAAGVTGLLDRLLHQGTLDAVLAHLDPEHVGCAAGSLAATTPMASPHRSAPEVRQATEPRETPEVPGESPPSRTADLPVPSIARDAWRALLTRWVRRWGAADRRSHWLAAHALAAVHGPAAMAHAERLIARLTVPVGGVRADPIEAPTDRLAWRSRERQSSTPEREPPPAARHPDEEQAAAPPPEPAHSLVRPRSRETFGDRLLELSPRAEPDWQPSRHGGLLLVLPALARLGIAEADRDGDLCLRLLHRIGDRLKIRKDDAIRRALPKPLPRTAPPDFLLPTAWQGLMRLPRGVDLGRADCLLAVCQLALARFLRRYAKISPRRLIGRPALVHATPTHIDLRFDARWVEMEVRLAGLDLNPGWVPWLGRVVTFHYDYEGGP
jgi:hypothetical protein